MSEMKVNLTVTQEGQAPIVLNDVSSIKKMVKGWTAEAIEYAEKRDRAALACAASTALLRIIADRRDPTEGDAELVGRLGVLLSNAIYAGVKVESKPDLAPQESESAASPIAP